MEYDITDWAGVCEQFTIMFQNLGEDFLTLVMVNWAIGLVIPLMDLFGH